jgi:hypothetical protein
LYSLIFHILHHFSSLFSICRVSLQSTKVFWHGIFSSIKPSNKKPYFVPRSTIGGNRPSQPSPCGCLPSHPSRQLSYSEAVIRSQDYHGNSISLSSLPNISSCPSIPIKSDHKFYVPSSKFSLTLILFVYSLVHAPSEFEFSGCWAQYSKSSHKCVTHITPTQHCID